MMGRPTAHSPARIRGAALRLPEQGRQGQLRAACWVRALVCSCPRAQGCGGLRLGARLPCLPRGVPAPLRCPPPLQGPWDQQRRLQRAGTALAEGGASSEGREASKRQTAPAVARQASCSTSRRQCGPSGPPPPPAPRCSERPLLPRLLPRAPLRSSPHHPQPRLPPRVPPSLPRRRSSSSGPRRRRQRRRRWRCCVSARRRRRQPRRSGRRW
jgi:hypothetical protein